MTQRFIIIEVKGDEVSSEELDEQAARIEAWLEAIPDEEVESGMDWHYQRVPDDYLFETMGWGGQWLEFNRLYEDVIDQATQLGV